MLGGLLRCQCSKRVQCGTLMDEAKLAECRSGAAEHQESTTTIYSAVTSAPCQTALEKTHQSKVGCEPVRQVLLKLKDQPPDLNNC